VPIPYAGQLAALGTAGCWAASTLAFDAACQRIGSLAVNILRLLVAFVLLAVACQVLRGRALPLDASAHAWLWLALSGLAGFAFGDLCLLRAYAFLGPRLAALMMSLAPPMTAAIGWLLLGERLSPRQLLGMALTVAGIGIAILERPRAAAAAPAPGQGGHRTAGVALGAGGALGQAGGLVLSKLGMGSYDPVAATQIRVLAGIAAYAVILLAVGWWPRVRASLADRAAMGYTSIGAFFGPFLGVSLSLFAVQRTLSGVAASLMATTPILVIPAVVVLHGERVGWGGLVGTGVAVGGVALLFLG
jgi:drug/metabolite transporter (DMT)-like permease